MQKSRIIFLLLSPSTISFVACVVLSLLILAVANWSYTTHDPIIYQQIYGPDGLATNFSHLTNSFSSFADALTAKYLSYQVFVFIVAVVVGVGVYFLLQMLSRALANVSDTYSSIHASNVAVRRHNQEEVGLRLAIRLVSLVTWFFYWLLTLKVILPYVLLASRVRFQDFFIGNGWLYALLAFVVLALTIHLHIVFMRFVTLRPRLFGGTDELLAARLSK